MIKLYHDIETIPASDPAIIAHITETLKPPGTLKNPDKIEAWLEDPENLNKAIAKTSLSGLYGQICCLGYAIDDDAPVMLVGDEADILNQFCEVAIEVSGGGRADVNHLIGFNCNDFDIPFISQRMMRHGLGPLYGPNIKPYDRLVSDVEEMFLGNPRDFLSLVNLCVALGVEKPLDEIDGSQVGQAWIDGRIDQIMEHCESDVIATRSCYKAITKG